MSQTKVCRHCGRRKALSRFYANSKPDCPTVTIRPECKACTTKRRLKAKTKKARRPRREK